jgi:hypothetical protein
MTADAAATPKLFYLNAMFDLELGGYPVDKVKNAAFEMSALAMLLGNDADRVLLDSEIPREFRSYLEKKGISTASPDIPGESGKGFEAVPWGWNVESAARLTSLDIVCDHPDLVIVKKVNGRSFCAGLNAATDTGVPGCVFCANIAEAREAAERLAGQFPLVAKPQFGGSGFGFVRIDDVAAFGKPPKRGIGRLLNRGGFTLEPWCARIYDVSSSCRIGKNGAVTGLCHYRCHTTESGAFFAVSLGPTDPVIDPWRDRLTEAASAAAAALAQNGYFGPAGFDSFVYRDRVSGRELLAPVIEINARHVMSAIARALHEKVGLDRYSLFRFITDRHAALPDSYGSLERILGDDCYDPSKRRGALPVTPLRISQAGGWRQPARNAFFIVAERENEVLAMDDRLRNRIKPGRK